jgi:hypothetical protein
VSRPPLSADPPPRASPGAGIPATAGGPAGRAWLTALWCSFLAACLATVMFFAFVDPAPVVAVLRPTGAAPGRTALYSIGFLFFWTFCALAASLTAWLLRPPPSP